MTTQSLKVHRCLPPGSTCPPAHFTNSKFTSLNPVNHVSEANLMKKCFDHRNCLADGVLPHNITIEIVIILARSNRWYRRQCCRRFATATNGVCTATNGVLYSLYKWGLAPLANCECGVSEQTADHIISQCPIHRAPRGMFGLMVLDDETRCWLKSLTVSI